MPQDGSNNYQYPPGTPGIPDTTIESEAYNTFLDDLVTNDLNIPRPIHRGGTNATTAHQALINLSGEEGKQHVTNYDTHPWVNGSFWSAGGTTGEPIAGHGHVGIYCGYDTDNFAVLLATDVNSTTGDTYIRVKQAGVWGAWSLRSGNVTDMDTRYVNVAGDTMVGDLQINHASPLLAIMKTASGAQSAIFGRTGSSNRWSIVLGDATTEAGSSLGSNFLLARYNDGGVFVDAPLTFTRSSGESTFLKNAHFKAGAAGSGCWYDSVGGVDRFFVGSDAATDSFRIYSNVVADNLLRINAASGLATFRNTMELGQGFKGRQGTGGAGFISYVHNFEWTGALYAWVDATNVGVVGLTSDYRTKKDVTDLPGMWDTVKALRPIKYTQAQFSPPSHVKHVAGEVAKARKEAEDNPAAAPREVTTGPLFAADDVERWGFLAHELQETLTPSASTGVKDSPDTVQSPNPFTLIAALTKALQEAMARIEALEAQQTP